MSPQGILLFLFVGASMLFAAGAAGLSAVFLFELWRLGQLRRRQASARSAFLNKLLRGLAGETIQGIGDVHHSYRAFFGVDVLKSFHLEEVTDFLRQAMRRIASQSGKTRGGQSRAKIEALQELLAANQRALEIERMCVPFSGTPEPEREVLRELFELSAEDKPKARVKLDSLAKAIRFRQDAVERLGQESARSLRLARWGWYGTLALATLAGILALICLGL